MSERNSAIVLFFANYRAVVGLTFVLMLIGIALFAPLLAPFDPTTQDLLRRDLSPTFTHWFGTDRLGRDVFSRVIHGTRVSLGVGFSAMAISILLGSLIGAVAGFFRGWVDFVIIKVIDAMLSVPGIFLLVTSMALFRDIFPSSVIAIVVIYSLFAWMESARLVRSEVLSLRERDFMLAARGLGCTAQRILTRHVAPNTLSPIIVAATLKIGVVILVESSLSFLGLGVQPPTPSWGRIINDSLTTFSEHPWVWGSAGGAILLTVLSFNLLGDGVRDALDPRSKE